jgi:lysophospholipase L1-like esterase
MQGRPAWSNSMNPHLGLTAVTLFAAFSAGAAPNLVPNGSFEEADAHGAISGWVPETVGMTTVRFARDLEVKRSGAAAARMTIGPDDNPSWPAYCFRLPVQPGQCYSVEAWISTRDVSRQAYVATDFLDAKGERVTFASGGTVSGTTTEWTRVAVVAQIPGGAVTMSVRLILYGSGTAWFDDVTVVRDEAAERALVKLREPLPAEWVTRATTAEGDPARLHRLFQAAAVGGRYTVGVIGGSITAGASASNPEARYQAYVVNWLREHFPKAEWALVNAGIGATGTNYGCLRVQRDLLAKEPDLVVTEYAVNDGNTQECAETYEGLLRQILASPKQPAVLMLFMMNQAGGNAQEWQSKLGRHYSLPLLSYRDLLWPEIEAKRMAWSDISPDAVHPNDVGHAAAGKLLNTRLARALATVPTAPVAAPAKELPAALLTDVYQATRLTEAEDLKPAANTGWSYDATNAWVKAWKATAPGSVLEFEVTGEQLFLSYWRIRGPMGRAQITIDGAQPSVQEAWFDQTWGGYRHMIRLATGKPGPHRLRLELLAEKHAESTGTEFRLLCLGSAGK